MPILILARLTVQETARRHILRVTVILSLAFLLFYALCFNALQHHFLAGAKYLPGMQMGWGAEARNMLTMVGLYGLNLITLLLTALLSVDTLAGEIASGTLQALLAKPVRRSQVVLGKWLGLASLQGLYVFIMGSSLAAIVYGLSRYLPPNLLSGLGLMWLSSLLLLSLALAGGSLLPTLANGAMLVCFLGVGLLGSWMEQVGSVLGDTSSFQMGTAIGLLIPCESLWLRAAYLMRPNPASPLSFTPMMPVLTHPTPAMTVYALGYTLLALAVCLYWFAKRDI